LFPQLSNTQCCTTLTQTFYIFPSLPPPSLAIHNINTSFTSHNPTSKSITMFFSIYFTLLAIAAAILGSAIPVTQRHSTLARRQDFAATLCGVLCGIYRDNCVKVGGILVSPINRTLTIE
jgi:hypothetical protein